MFKEFPDNDAGSDADVERVFGAELRQFDATLALVDDRLLHSLHLVAQYNGVFSWELRIPSIFDYLCINQK